MACKERLNALPAEIRNYLREKAGVDFNPETGEGKESWAKAAKDLREQYLNQVHDIFHQAGVSGYEKPSTTIVSEKVKNKLSQLKSKQNATQKGNITESDIGEHQGVSPRSNIPENGSQIREGNGEQASSSSSHARSGEIKEEVTSPSQVDTLYPVQRDRVEFETSVKSLVDGLVHNKEIAKAVIGLLPVNMVDNFISTQGTSKNSFSDEAMLLNALSSSNDLSIIEAVQNSTKDLIARWGAELTDSLSRGEIEKFNAAVTANKLDLSAVLSLILLHGDHSLSVEDIKSIFTKTAPGTILSDMASVGGNKVNTSAEFANIFDRHLANIGIKLEQTKSSDSGTLEIKPIENKPEQPETVEPKPKRKPKETKPPVTQPEKAPIKRFTQKLSDKASDELGDLFNELSNLAKKQGIVPSEEDEVQKSILSLKIVAKATEYGIYKFADIVAFGLDKLGARMDALFTYVRDAYLAYQGRATDEVLDQMDNTKEVRNFDYEQFKNKDGNDTTISDTDGAAPDGMAGNQQSTGTKGTGTRKQTQRLSGKPSGTSQQGSTGTNEEGEEQGGSTTGGQGINNRPGSTTKPGTENAGEGISDYQGQTGRLKPLPTNPADQNHIIKPSDTIVPEGNPAKVTANMDAVILLRQLEAENRNATPEEKNKLAKFVGWGGLAGYLNEIDEDDKTILDNIFLGKEDRVGGYYSGVDLPAAIKLDTNGKSFDQIVKELQRRYAELILKFPGLARYVNANRTVSGIPAGGHLPLDTARNYAIPYLMNDAELQAAGASTINAHYTDRSIITPIWDLIKKLGFTGGNVLESSAGVGHFFGLMPKNLQDNSNLTGVELDSLTGRILKKLYPDANIQVKGFETTNFPNNSFDLAVSNVPFAKEGLVTDAKNKDIDKFNLHNYFIAKNLKQLKPGGIAVMITSKSTMDNAASAKARRWFLSAEGGNSELIGAVRLPNNAFDKNAATQVTTDVMVFQKRRDTTVRNTNPFANTDLIRSEVIDGEIAEINLNEYYVAHPENMIGEMKYAFEVGSGGLYGKTDATLHAKPGTDIGKEVKELFDKFPTDILETDYAPSDTNISTNTKPGKMFAENGKVYVSNGEQGVEIFLKPEQKKIATAYLGVRDGVRDLVAKELSGATDAEIEADRIALNKKYDDFVKKYGTINKNDFLYDHDIEFSIAAAAEDVKETTVYSETGGKSKKSVEVKKGPIFSKRMNFPRFEPETAENLRDAIQISLAYRNNIDPDYVAKMMGVTPAEAVENMIDQKLVFQNPSTALLETPEEYLSGNVRKKYEEAKEAAATDANYMRNVVELEKIQPEDKAISQIPFKMGVSWIPASMYKEFIKEKLGVDINVSYLDKAGIWALDKDTMKGDRDTNNTNTYAVGYETGIDIISDIMANRSTIINDKISLPGGGYSIRKNEVQTEAAAQMQDKIVDEFRQWVATHEKHGKEIERVYNDRFNNLVEKQYNAPPFEYFPGASRTGFKLRLHQLKSILRGLSGNPLLLAHTVGTGKTAIMQTIAMEWRRLKTAKKPLIVVQNSTLKDFAAKFHKLYPGANILVSSDADKGEAERRRFYARIAQGDWDAIIIPQSQFDRIPDNPDRVAAYLQEQIAEMQQSLDNSQDSFVKYKLKKEIEGLQEDINQAYMSKEEIAAIKTQSSEMYVDEDTGELVEGKAPSSRSKGGKQKVKAAAEKLLKLNARVKKQAERRVDNVMNFEDMGIDGLIVDEAHEYKKLGFQTGLQNIRGIDTGRSQKALSLKMKVSAVKDRTGGKNIVFATGTPITNTMAESWTMMRYLQPEILEEMGIQYFDQFANTFTEVVPSLEQNAGGRFDVVERMKEFVNAKQLQSVFKKMADVVSTDDIPEFVSDPENAPPALKGGGFEMVLIPISKPMASTMRRLADHYDWWKSLTGNEKKELSYLPLVLYQIAKKASIDLRLIDPRLEDDPESKVNYAVKNALKIYKEFDQYKGTQMIFSDSFQSGNSAIVHQILNVPAGLKPFNLYEDIKKKLIAGGVPAKEIIVMSDVKNDAGKVQMMDKMNSGEVRFVIGSTAKMGIGVNAHERMIALHHIDAPDRPDQFTQRNGRLIRPGNMFTKLKIPVQILTYGIKDTRDATSYGRLRDKEKFVSDFMSGKGGDRVEDTGEEDEAGSAGDFFSEMSAQLSGSKYATELIFAEKELRTERNKAEAFRQRKQESEFKLHNKISGREDIKDRIKKANESLAIKKESFPDNKITSLKEQGEPEVHEKLTETLDKIIDATAKFFDKENKRLAKESEEAGLKSRKIPNAATAKFKINGLDATYRYEKPYEHLDAQSWVLIPALGLSKEATSAASVLSVVRNYIKDIDEQPQRYKDLLKKEEHNIETLKKNLAETFDFDKLEEIEHRVDRLKAAVLAESKEKEAVERKEVADKKAEEEKKEKPPEKTQDEEEVDYHVISQLPTDVEEMKEVVLDLISEGTTSLKKIEDIVVAELGENMRPLVKEAYNEATKEVKLTEVGKNELTTGFAKRINNFIDNVFGKSKDPAGHLIMDKNLPDDVLGYVDSKTGKIVLNANKINPNTPVHESGHLWTEWARDNDSDLYNRGVELISGSPYLSKIEGIKFYQDQAAKLPEEERDEYFAHEALAAAIGDKGAQFITEAKRKSFAEWAKALWDKIGRALGFKGVTADQLQNMSFDDFMQRAAVDILKGQPQATSEQQEQEEPQPEPEPEIKTGEGTDLRRFTKQVLMDEAIIPKARIAEKLEYVKRKNAITIEEATDIINQVGVDAAYDLVAHDPNLHPATRSVMGQMLIKKFNQLAANAKDEETRNYYIDKTADAADYVSEKLGTEGGQQIQAFAVFGQLSPEAHLRSAIKDIKKQAEKRKQRRAKDLLTFARKLNAINQDTANAIVDSAKLNTAVDQVEKGRVARAEDKILKARERRQKILDQHKASKGQNLYSAVPGLTPEGIEFVGNLAKTYIDEGLANLEVIAGKIINHLQDVTGRNVDAVASGNIRDIVQPLIEKVENERVTEGLRDLEGEIHRIIKEHYTIGGETKNDLIDKFMEQADLENKDAEELANSVQEEFEKIATRKKQELFEKDKNRFERIKKGLAGGKTVESRTLEDEIIRLSNLGTVDNETLLKILADKLGTGKLSPAQGQRILFLAERIKNAPEGSPKREATEDLLAYRAKLKGTSWGEVSQGVWYANVLSGIGTHIKNIVSTFFNGLSFFAVRGLGDPLALPVLLYGGAKGLKRGAVEAWHTLTTGRSPIHVSKLETPNILERITFMGGLLNPGNWLKYVGRLMVAEDVLQFQGLKEMRAAQYAYMQARQAGYRNPFSRETWKAINENLLDTPDRLEEAREQVKEEGLTGNDARRRTYELMELSRPIEMTNVAYGFAARGTFNHDTEGSLGALTDGIGRLIDNHVQVGGLKPLRLIIPFTRIITNVANNTIDFSPLGFVRAGFNRRGLFATEASGKRRPMTEEERKDLIIKAALGTASMAALLAMDALGIIAISGAGPDDIKKRMQLVEEGWQPYSIRIGGKWFSYKLTPMVFAWGLVGHSRDRARYGKEDEQTIGHRVALGAWDGVKLISDMTWINSAAPIMSAISSGNPNEAGAILTNMGKNTLKGFILPNAYTQAAERAESFFNVPQKQVNGIMDALITNIPIARNSLNDKINALGDPIVKDVDILVSSETHDPVWRFLLDHKGWVAPVNKGNVMVFDHTTNQDRPATNDEYYEFSKRRGQIMKGSIQEIMENGVMTKIDDGKEKFTIKPDEATGGRSANELSTYELNKVLTLYEGAATRQAKKELNYTEDEK